MKNKTFQIDTVAFSMVGIILLWVLSVIPGFWAWVDTNGHVIGPVVTVVGILVFILRKSYGSEGFKTGLLTR
jgi:hypothetical protein